MATQDWDITEHAYIDSANPDTSYPLGFIYIERIPIEKEAGDFKFGYWMTDFSGTIPAGSTIDVAELHIYADQRGGAPEDQTWTMYAIDNVDSGGGANSTTTMGPPGTLTAIPDPGWDANEHIGMYVACNGKFMVVASNTSDTLTAGAYTWASDPGDGHAWTMNRYIVSITWNNSTYWPPYDGISREFTPDNTINTWQAYDVKIIVEHAIDVRGDSIFCCLFTCGDPEGYLRYSEAGERPFHLHIEWTPPGAANVKKVSGVAWASVKQVSGVAEASIKKVSGIAAN